mgnify:FL=1
MNKITLVSLIFLMMVSACDSVKRGLSGQKKKTTQEFLIKSKDPLVLPPRFNELPEPGKTPTDNSEVDLENNIEKLLKIKKNNNNKKNNKSIKSIEDLIIKEIKN